MAAVVLAWLVQLAEHQREPEKLVVMAAVLVVVLVVVVAKVLLAVLLVPLLRAMAGPGRLLVFLALQSHTEAAVVVAIVRLVHQPVVLVAVVRAAQVYHHQAPARQAPLIQVAVAVAVVIMAAAALAVLAVLAL